MVIRYKKRHKYKYTLFRPVTYPAGVEVLEAGTWGPVTLTPKGNIRVTQGYAWDGPSGPAIDSKNFMRGSLIHDVLYQLMREEKIDQDQRKRADQVLREICRADGMSKIRAWWVYRAVRVGAAKSAKPDLLTAP